MTDTAFLIDLRPMARRRRKLAVSQRGLGALCGITGSCVSNYECGRRPVPLAFLMAAARGLGTPAWDLFEVHEAKGTGVRAPGTHATTAHDARRRPWGGATGTSRPARGHLSIPDSAGDPGKEQ